MKTGGEGTIGLKIERLHFELLLDKWRENHYNKDITGSFVKAWLGTHGDVRTGLCLIYVDNDLMNGNCRGYVKEVVSVTDCEVNDYIQFPKNFILQHFNEDFTEEESDKEILELIKKSKERNEEDDSKSRENGEGEVDSPK